MATGNPTLNESYFADEANAAPRSSSNVMTVNGAVIKSGVLTAIVVAVAAVAWSQVFPYGIGHGINSEMMMLCLGGGGIGGLVLSLIICFFPKSAPTLAPLYAACEGACLGAISGLFASNPRNTGIVLEAGMLTVGVLVTMLTGYMTGFIVMSNKLRTGIIAATGGICLVYIATMVLNLFHINVPYIYGNGIIGIGFSVLVVIIAAYNLVLDFDTIETGAKYGAPKYMEWYSAFALLVTLVWLYLEILRLLSKLNSRN